MAAIRRSGNPTARCWPRWARCSITWIARSKSAWTIATRGKARDAEATAHDGPTDAAGPPYPALRRSRPRAEFDSDPRVPYIRGGVMSDQPSAERAIRAPSKTPTCCVSAGRGGLITAPELPVAIADSAAVSTEGMVLLPGGEFLIGTNSR